MNTLVAAFTCIVFIIIIGVTLDSSVEENELFWAQKEADREACMQAFRKDFPEYKHVVCSHDATCTCTTWEYKGGWEGKSTRSVGEAINHQKHHFYLK